MILFVELTLRSKSRSLTRRFVEDCEDAGSVQTKVALNEDTLWRWNEYWWIEAV